jgi:hypothetical protein
MIEQDPTQGPPEQNPADPTPDPGASTTVDWESDDNIYKRRFEEYRSQVADPKINRLSQYEQAVQDFQSGDPAEMRRAAAILGIAEHLEIEDPEPQFYDDPADELRAELEALREEFGTVKSTLSQREQQEQESWLASTIEGRLDEIQGLDEADKDVVLALAVTLPPDQEGLPDVEKAYQTLVARDEARQREWGAGKRRIPSSIRPGASATQQKHVSQMNDQERQEYMAQEWDMRREG